MNQHSPSALDAQALKAALVGIGVSRPYASQLVNGRRTPSYKLALRIQQELGVPPEHWAGRTTPQETRSGADCPQKPATIVNGPIDAGGGS